MRSGAEYVSAHVLETLWREIDAAFAARQLKTKSTTEELLKQLNPAWNVVGRVYFNLAENRKDDLAPFAFLATYTHQLSAHGKAQHVPLCDALRKYAGAKNRARLLSLLLPVQRGVRPHASTPSDLTQDPAVRHGRAEAEWSVPREGYGR